MAKTYSGQEVINRLVKEYGFIKVSHRGSHVKLKKFSGAGDVVTVVPLHKELAIGTLRGLLNLAQIDYREFILTSRPSKRNPR